MRLAGECALPCSVEHSRGTFIAVPMVVNLCSTLTLWNIAYLLGFTAHDSYSHLFTALFP
jgi:hypothetical protein